MDDWEDFPAMPFRDRSNTWPRRIDVRPEGSPPPSVPDIIEEPSDVQSAKVVPAPRNKQRRNVWRNKSYAELITEAILSTDEKRMMLSQIYNWMVTNVDCFSDKQADNSSAGWKNSIRHNLSLHDSFMKLPNEQAGKSNWWVLNPNAKSSKMPRRRISTHHNPIMDIEQPDEPFRRRTKSDCSSYKYRRLSPPSSSSYSPNCSGSSHDSEFEKQEAYQILDSLIEAMKLEARANIGSQSGDQADSFVSHSCNTETVKQETNVLVSSVTEALKIEREGNKYLEAVEPISTSPPTISENFTLQSASGFSENAMLEFSDISFKSSQNQYSVHSSYSDSQRQTTQNISLLATQKSNVQSTLSSRNFDNQKDRGMFQASRKQNQFQIKEPECASTGSADPIAEFRRVLLSPTLKQRENDDSSGRPRSKSYSGRPTTNISKRKIADTRVYEVIPFQDSFQLDLKDYLRNSYEELSLQDIEPWPITEEWQPNFLISTNLNS